MRKMEWEGVMGRSFLSAARQRCHGGGIRNDRVKNKG